MSLGIFVIEISGFMGWVYWQIFYVWGCILCSGFGVMVKILIFIVSVVLWKMFNCGVYYKNLYGGGRR